MFVSTGFTSQWCSACIPRSFTSVEAGSPPQGDKSVTAGSAATLVPLLYERRPRGSNSTSPVTRPELAASYKEEHLRMLKSSFRWIARHERALWLFLIFAVVTVR